MHKTKESQSSMRASDDIKSPEELSVKMESEEESLDDIDDS